MAKYCLTYHAKDTNLWGEEELKMEVSDLLIKNKGLYLENPIAGTILFEDGHPKDNISSWQSLITRALHQDIFYYLCVLAKNPKGDFIERNEGDPDMNDSFQESLDELEED